MTIELLTIIFLLAFGALESGLAAVVIWRRGVSEWLLRWVVAYLIVAGALQWAIGILMQTTLPNGGTWAAAYALTLLAALFAAITQLVLRSNDANWRWYLIPVIGLILITLLVFNVSLISAFFAIEPSTLSLIIAFFVWATLIVSSAYGTLRAHRSAQHPLHRNRLVYWIFALILTVLTDLLFFAGRSDLGTLFRLLQTALIAYTITNHRLPDVRQIVRTFVAYVAVGVLAAGLYVVSITALQFGFQQTFGLNYWVAFGITLAIVAVVLHPLVQVVQTIVLSHASGIGYDTAQAVREYSASISNILNIELLAKKVTSLIQDTMNARSVRLYLVDNTRLDGKNIVRLRPVQPVEGSVLFERSLSADNPIVTYLAAEARPLTQYDIDLLPRYRQMPPTERAWLASLGMDMYVPIHSRGQWIGLLTLGPKTTDDRYFRDDMALLDTLADQTAIALENARLVTDLVSLNRDLKRAYADLEKAHSQLNELDRLKSAFIGAITHELRTPIANIQFSIQLLEKYGFDNMLPDQQEQMRQLDNAATHAKIMVDNLVNFATFLGKQGELKLAEFSFSELLGETIVMLEPHARRKDITLRSDVADEGLPPINGDRARVGDAIYHLMQNAIKFTGSEGVVTARCWPKEGCLYFAVTDTGVGIPPDKLAGLWGGFEQMADPLKRGLEGLGLGLALVKYVVTAHDGEVTAESVEGEGSTFGFHIPIGGPAPRTTLREEVIAEAHPPSP